MKTFLLRQSRGVALLAFAVLSVMLGRSAPAQSQVHYGIDTNSVINLSGTSTLRAWTMTAHDFTGSAVLNFENGDALSSITQFSIRLPVHNLRSDSRMTEKSAYKALKDDKFKYITFDLHSANLKPSGSKNYILLLHGDLTIAGVPQPTTLLLYAAVDDDGSVLCSGSLPISLSEFDIDRPTMLLGAMKIGDKLSLTYHLRLSR
jgi:polyisoprenoid-binding protein YceI